MAYEPPTNDFSAPRMQFLADQNQFEPQKARPRASSMVHVDGNMPDIARYAQPHQPVDEAVTSTVNNADTSHYVPPEVIAQITATVLSQLKNNGMDGTTPMPTNHTNIPPPPPLVQEPVPLSPSVSASSQSMFSRNSHTPPSPHKHADYSNHGSPPPPQSTFSPHLPKSSPPNFPSDDRRTSSPLSQNGESGPTRPKGPTRLSTSREETILEKIWGPLFDEDGNSTAKLGQLLRGLAVHIIEDYGPCNSIVITPEKMLRYYDDVKLPHELYPWSAIFDESRCKISRMYRQLSCQHHLVQEQDDQRPDIPGLTPVGFERWVTLLIKAHPEEEYQRLQKAVLDMPINNPDEKNERFPKEISRRLFPDLGDREVQKSLETAISEHGDVELPKRGDRENSPSHRPSVGGESVPGPNARTNVAPDYVLPTRPREPSGDSVSLPPLARASIERERAPYSNTPSEAIIDDTNPYPPPPQSLERERKPYSALPGGGRAWEDEAKAGKPRSSSTASKIGRSDSTAQPRNIPMSSNGPNVHRPMDIPKPEIHHHHRTSSNAQRNRSPSFSRVNNDFRRPDGDGRSYQPPPLASSVPSTDMFDESTRRHPRDQADRARRQAEEDARMYGQSPGARARYDRDPEGHGPHRTTYANDEDYYRNSGRGAGSGYDYSQPYGGPVYR